MTTPSDLPERIDHRFLEEIPDFLEDATVYVSIAYTTAIHKCLCGCGNEVVTPLSPTDWRLVYDGRTISLDPSIGNWNFPCQSHYWIEENRVRWAPKWSRSQIESARSKDRARKADYFQEQTVRADISSHTEKRPGLWKRIKRLLSK